MWGVAAGGSDEFNCTTVQQHHVGAVQGMSVVNQQCSLSLQHRHIVCSLFVLGTTLNAVC